MTAIPKSFSSFAHVKATGRFLVKFQRSFCRFSIGGMRLVQFLHGGRQHVGAEVKPGGDVVDFNSFHGSVPDNIIAFLRDGERCFEIAKRALQSGTNVLKRDSVTFKAPVTNGEKVICIGMNYFDHCKEQNIPIPTEPLVFSKFPSAVSDPYGPVVRPAQTEKLDWEVELAIVIGKGGSHIKEEDAMNHVAGYTIAHDVSARDIQFKGNGGQWLLSKTFDTFCPLGPCLVTRDGLSDPHNLGIRCRVNGEEMQNSNTSNLVFKTQALIPYISRFFSLSVGDVILTGTPGGVGVFRKPPIFLKHGDVVECEIDEIGCLRNVIQDFVSKY